MIGFVIAMESEAAPFIKRFEVSRKGVGGRTFVRLDLCGVDAVLAICGIGKVNAAYTTALLIRTYDPDIVVNVGVSGGIGKGLEIGQVVAVEKCVQHDVDTSPLGDPKGFVSTVNTVYFPTDPTLTDLFAEMNRSAKGVAASGEQFVADGEKKRFIADFFHAEIADMESGAIAQCALIAGKKFLCFRAVSDLADGSAPKDFPSFVKTASETLCTDVVGFIKSAKSMGYLD